MDLGDNAITDVPGIRVGHATRDEPGWLTGSTVVVPPPGSTGGVDVRGGGPGTRETDLLDPRNAVTTVDAVLLSGGSAFGLSAADGVLAELVDAGRGWPVGAEPGQVVPIVPGAIIFDLGRGGAWRHHPGPEEGRAAFRAADSGRVAEGSVGAGTGAVAGGLKGGIGTASARLPDGGTVGALVAVNAVGSPLSPSGELLGADLLRDGEVDLPRPDPAAAQTYWDRWAAEMAALRAGTATTLAVVATDLELDKAGCATLARVSHDGFARAISPVHTPFDGDTVFALSTKGAGPPTPFATVELHTAAADCVTRAIVRAVLAAGTVDRSAEGGVVASSYREAIAQPSE
ncbi:P1 family peptidase [Janibacter corallicola]|uniref:P1 family peptidase n=1 Tax=Janibacter corallicola TaxID=415212 RepID=UPI000A04E66C|nr:P1 family peptidase [Janibacter corallicola]